MQAQNKNMLTNRVSSGILYKQSFAVMARWSSGLKSNVRKRKNVCGDSISREGDSTSREKNFVNREK